MAAKILIIDDSKFMRIQLAGILAEAGYELIEAADGASGIDLANRTKPDCIILDLLLPDMTGQDVLKILRMKRLAAPIIVHTADIQATTREACLELGAMVFLNKPPRRDELLRAVETALARA